GPKPGLCARPSVPRTSERSNLRSASRLILPRGPGSGPGPREPGRSPPTAQRLLAELVEDLLEDRPGRGPQAAAFRRAALDGDEGAVPALFIDPGDRAIEARARRHAVVRALDPPAQSVPLQRGVARIAAVHRADPVLAHAPDRALGQHARASAQAAAQVQQQDLAVVLDRDVRAALDVGVEGARQVRGVAPEPVRVAEAASAAERIRVPEARG